MSTRYLEASVFILKAIESPAFTEILVANPWMLGSPAPFTSHSVDGDPGSRFSRSTGLRALQPSPLAPMLLAERASAAHSSASNLIIRAVSIHRHRLSWCLQRSVRSRSVLFPRCTLGRASGWSGTVRRTGTQNVEPRGTLTSNSMTTVSVRPRRSRNCWRSSHVMRWSHQTFEEHQPLPGWCESGH